MVVERNRLSLADTLGATSPIAGAVLASAAATARHNPSSMGASTDVPLVKSFTPKGASQLKIAPVTQPFTRPLSQPVSQPLGHSQSHSASLSASHSISLSLDQSQSQPVGQTSVADRLTANQSAVLRYLIETRPYIVRFAQLGQAVGLGEATTRTILRRLKAIGFIKYQRARDGQLQGVSVSFNASLCEQFTQGHSLGQSLSQPGSKPLCQPLTSKKMDLEEEINPSEDDLAVKLGSITDELFELHWADLVKICFRADRIRLIVKQRLAVGKPINLLLEGLDHANFVAREHKDTMVDGKGRKVKNLAGYFYNSFLETGYYGRPAGYVSSEEKAEKDREEEATRVVEARKRREEAEYQAWLDALKPGEREAILLKYKDLPGTENGKLIFAWNQEVKEMTIRCVEPGTTSAE